jgi:hypothetical protein
MNCTFLSYDIPGHGAWVQTKDMACLVGYRHKDTTADEFCESYR